MLKKNAIISLLEEESVFTTDDDGYYEIDELLAGKYNLRCHSPGYVEHENFKAEAAAESLVIDFILLPVNAALN